MSRDLRDPKALGQIYLNLRKAGMSIRVAAASSATSYSSGRFISNDPSKHHSRTPQTLGDLDTGGAS
jgi:hypothetical protein